MTNEIIRGTTPTIVYTFSSVNVRSIVVAYLTIEQAGKVLVEKDLSEATIGDNSLNWLLSQRETLMFSKGTAKPMVNWLLADGTRGASRNISVTFVENQKNGVI